MAQLPLPLAYYRSTGYADYFVSEANREAAAWLGGEAATRTLLVGPAGSGKSHLGRIFAARPGALLLDDADRMPDQAALFHAWNAATPTQPVLYTARIPARHWARLSDLASRLAATPTLVIAEPDDALLLAVLAKQFADRGVRIDPDVAAFIALRIERSFAAVAATVAAIDARALADSRDVTIPLAREVLEAQGDLLDVIDLSPRLG